MRRFVAGVDRGQGTLFPERLEDWIGEDNPVRVIDVFVEELELAGLGFSGVDPEATGRPSYHPSVLLIAIDGSKFKAVNNRDKNFTRAKMDRRMAQIEQSVARYLQQLDTADRQEPSEALKTKTSRLKEKIEKLKEQMQRLKVLNVTMLATPDQPISLTDPDSRSMATSGRGSGVVGYNVQIAVDTE